MKYENCKNCAYLEYHDDAKNENYSGYFCGAFDYLTDNAKIENISECENTDPTEV